MGEKGEGLVLGCYANFGPRPCAGLQLCRPDRLGLSITESMGRVQDTFTGQMLNTRTARSLPCVRLVFERPEVKGKTSKSCVVVLSCACASWVR